MADNTTLNSGSGGDTIATDEISGVKHQRVKIQYGDDGSATDVSDVNPLPIDDAGGSLTVDGTVTANLGATDNAVLDQLEVNTSYGDNLGGGVEAGALRVTLASDSSGVVSVDDDGGSLTVDGTVTANLGAVDNAVLDTIDAALDTINGKLVAGTVIGDVNLGATDNAVLDAMAASLVDIDTGGSGFSSIDLDETEEQIKGSAGTIYSIYAWNATADPLWLQIFNATAASVAVGTDAPTYNFPIPANASSDVAGVQIGLPNKGLAMSTAITMAVTTGSGTNSGAPGANAAGVFVVYD